MLRPPETPEIWIIQPDAPLRTTWAAELRQDGMQVVEFGSPESALAALSKGAKAALLVAEPATGRLTYAEFFEQARAGSPRVEVVFTPCGELDTSGSPASAHVLVRPFGSGKLSRFIRLVAAKPALRSTLQRQFRQARALQMDVAEAAQ
jgi:DNA-binding NtrC family response regulator